jgi:hypothetical protein
MHLTVSFPDGSILDIMAAAFSRIAAWPTCKELQTK